MDPHPELASPSSPARAAPGAAFAGGAAASPGGSLVLGRRRGPRVRAGSIRAALAAGTLMTGVLAVPAVALGTGVGIVFDNAQQLVATAAAACALLLTAVAGRADRRRVAAGLTVALVFAAVGQVIWDLQPGGSTTASELADVFFVFGVCGGLASLGGVLFAGLDRRTLDGVAIDATVLFLASMTFVLALWLRAWGAAGDLATLFALLPAAVLFAASGAGLMGLVARRVRLGFHGPWLVAAGLCLAGIAWLAWLHGVIAGSVTQVMPTDFAYSAGVLLLAGGTGSWTLEPATDPGYEAIARRIGDLVPTLAAVASVLLEIVPRSHTGIDPVDVGVAAIVAAAALRQGLLLGAERQAREAERLAAARLERETRERAETIVSLSRMVPGATPEATARLICAEALRLEGIDSAVFRAFGRRGEVVPLAIEGLGDIGRELVGLELSPSRAADMRARAAAGPWVETIDPDADDLHLQAKYQAGLRATVNVPIRWHERVMGALGLGTFSEPAAARLEDRASTIRELGLMAAALIGPALAERERIDVLRESVSDTIARRAFEPVFQPVVELGTGSIVAFEGLTRFKDGVRPDHHFADAAAAGVGPALELACIRATLDAAAGLPEDAWISLNVSPQLAMALVPLVSTLEGTRRSIVVEITEHVPVADYDALMRSLGTLRGHVRLAVDDAGAGYAGLRHILELRPHFVKLDISLVHSVNHDPARRAMIGSMVAFARETGCTLIAEGIEEPGELEILDDLGVALGQGFHLGAPARASTWTSTRATTGRAPGDGDIA